MRNFLKMKKGSNKERNIEQFESLMYTTFLYMYIAIYVFFTAIICPTTLK